MEVCGERGRHRVVVAVAVAGVVAVAVAVAGVAVAVAVVGVVAVVVGVVVVGGVVEVVVVVVVVAVVVAVAVANMVLVWRCAVMDFPARLNETCEAIASTSDRPTWLAARRTLLGASDVPAVLGLSPWTPAVEVWARKTSRYDESPDDVSEAMEIGTEIEPWLLDAVSRRTRCRVTHAGYLLRSKKWPWLGATLDGLIFGERGTPLAEWDAMVGAVETKVSGSAFAGEWANESTGRGLVPAHYMPQVDAQLAVTGLPFSVFGVLMGGRLAFRWCVVERNETRIDSLVNRTGEWWTHHVKHDVPPEPDGSDRASELISRMYPELGGVVKLEESALGLVSHIRELKAQVKGTTKQIEKMQQTLRMAIGNASAGELPDGQLVRLTTVKRKAFTVEPTEYRKLVLP